MLYCLLMTKRSGDEVLDPPRMCRAREDRTVFDLNEVEGFYQKMTDRHPQCEYVIHTLVARS